MKTQKAKNIFGIVGWRERAKRELQVRILKDLSRLVISKEGHFSTFPVNNIN